MTHHPKTGRPRFCHQVALTSNAAPEVVQPRREWGIAKSRCRCRCRCRCGCCCCCCCCRCRCRCRCRCCCGGGGGGAAAASSLQKQPRPTYQVCTFVWDMKLGNLLFKRTTKQIADIFPGFTGFRLPLVILEWSFVSMTSPQVTAEIYRQHGDALFEKRAYDQAQLKGTKMVPRYTDLGSCSPKDPGIP